MDTAAVAGHKADALGTVVGGAAAQADDTVAVAFGIELIGGIYTLEGWVWLHPVI